jgi:DNA-directed RNA polymerase specialized sigma24 family protein
MDSIAKGQELIQKIRDGRDNEAVKMLYKKVFPIVRKFVLQRYGTRDDAFDVFQDALVDFYNLVSTKTYKEEYDAYGYVFKLSSFKWLNRLKRNQKIEYKEDMEKWDLEVEEPQRDFMLLGKQESVLEEFFKPIGKKCIELLTHTILNNMLLEDVMLRMEFSSVAAVKMQHQRCKQKLMEEIDKRPELVNKLKRV